MKKDALKLVTPLIRISGIALWAGSIWLLVRYFGYGDSHPVNVLLDLVGMGPVLPELYDINWLTTSLLTIIVSILTACMFYTGLASICVIITQELAFLVEAGSVKKYRELEREPAEPVNGITGMLFTFVMGPKR